MIVVNTGRGINVNLSQEQAKVLITLLDMSTVHTETQTKWTDKQYYGLIAFRDELLFQLANSIGVDSNSPKQTSAVYDDVERMFATGRSVTN